MGKVKTYQVVVLISTILLLIGFLVYYAIDSKTSETLGDSVSDTVSADLPSQFEPDIDTDIVDIPPSSELPIPPVYTGEQAPHFDETDISALNALIEGMGEGVSVYYEDIHSGNVYTFNDEQRYFIASVIKAPYCMYLYELVAQGKCNLDDVYTFTSKDFKEGTGKLKETEFEKDELTDEEIPAEITMRELMAYAIIYSDNTAMELLRKRYNYDGYTEYAMGLGLNFKEDIAHIVDGKLTAKDGGVYAKAMFEFFENNPHGDELKSDMMKTRNSMIATKHPMARKYGWAEESFHDFAIVYSDHPYVLVILTDHDSGKKEDYKLFADISITLERLQAQKYDLVGE